MIATENLNELSEVVIKEDSDQEKVRRETIFHWNLVRYEGEILVVKFYKLKKERREECRRNTS